MTEAGASDLQALVARAEGGDAPAAHDLALRFGSGFGAPLDWDVAFRWLDVAADNGHDLAKAAREYLGPSPDLAAWFNPPRPEVISRQPHVLHVPGFIDAATCAWLIERAKPDLSRAAVYDNFKDAQVFEDARDNSGMAFDFAHSDMVLVLLRERIARAVGLPAVGLEPTQVLHYSVGQKFEPHFDYLDPARPGHRADLAESGQRIATFLIYLNDGFEGGETEMPSIGMKRRGAPGEALFWANVTPDGRPDVSTLHAGLPPISGEKWVLSQWCRNRAPRSLTEG